MNYFIKIDTGNPNDFVHAIINHHFTGKSEVLKAFGGRTAQSPLTESTSTQDEGNQQNITTVGQNTIIGGPKILGGNTFLG